MKKKLKTKGFIVALDGPAGAGKSTVAKALSEALKGRLLDTGAMYRSVALECLRAGAATEEQFGEIATKIRFSTSPRGKLLVNGKQLSKRIRTEEVSAMASYVSQFEGVRTVLTKKQRSLGREWAEELPVIVEGRDIGSVVFPDNAYKFFVTANAKERARRRQTQLTKMGRTKVKISTIFLMQAHRDNQDSKRKLAPLKKTKEAVLVNTSRKTVGEVVDYIMKKLPVAKD